MTGLPSGKHCYNCIWYHHIPYNTPLKGQCASIDVGFDDTCKSWKECRIDQYNDFITRVIYEGVKNEVKKT